MSSGLVSFATMFLLEWEEVPRLLEQASDRSDGNQSHETAMPSASNSDDGEDGTFLKFRKIRMHT